MAASSSRDNRSPSTRKMGDRSAPGQFFMAFNLGRYYPSLYVGKGNQAKVTEYFQENFMENCAWDIFVLMDPKGKRDPISLIPSVQFRRFLDKANQDLGTRLAIPNGPLESGNLRDLFFFAFRGTETTRPRYLGQMDSYTKLKWLEAQAYGLPQENYGLLSLGILALHEDTFDNIAKSWKPVQVKDKKKEDAALRRAQRQKASGRMVKRLQVYLGLRNKVAIKASPWSPGAIAANWTHDMTVPFKSAESVRFVCVDIEAWERDHRIVTEVGLAVLDRDDTMQQPPGRNAQNWFRLIKAHHFVIEEYTHLKNTRYVKGCPEKFEFGQSKTVSLDAINRTIGAIIGDNTTKDQRPVILVGHDLHSDMKYMKSLCYNIWRYKRFIDEIDTKDMHQRMVKGANGRSLTNVCGDLGLQCKYPHNAGNDAVYTLRAMIVMAVKMMTNQIKRNEQGPRQDEWSDGDVDDGGEGQVSPEPKDENPRASNMVSMMNTLTLG
ncbi:hypothetical protein F4778DRAFT_171810 [Xylariomycetidae sp. FL2044]|nr:hypothetical protein F4778DRAFT_171810 [Xylariomycetidae sp. FL2044]